MTKKITSLVNAEAIKRNRYYFVILIAIVVFLAAHQLAFRGKIDAFGSEDEGVNELFLNLRDYAAEKGQPLRAIFKTISRNVTYTSPNKQNEFIAAMSSVVVGSIKQDIGNLLYTIKGDGTKDLTGVENISLIRFLTIIF